MKAVGAALESSGHRVEFHKLEAERPANFFAAGWAALRRREAKLKEEIPKSLRLYELILVAGPVFAGRTSAELNTFLNNMPDAIGRRFGVFATYGSSSAEGQLRSIKARVEKAGGMIIYEDMVRRSTIMNPEELRSRSSDIAEQLLRPWVW